MQVFWVGEGMPAGAFIRLSRLPAVTGDQVIEEGEYLKSGKVFSRAGSTALSKGSESEGSWGFLKTVRIEVFRFRKVAFVPMIHMC